MSHLIKTYFERPSLTHITKLRQFILLRKNRPFIPGSASLKMFEVGDIIEVFFTRNISFLSFEGVCICLRKQKILSPDISFILRML